MATVLLLGHPVSHSMSPAMHNAAFTALGLAHRYEALDVPSAEVERAVAGLRGEGMLGANVTVPHKLAVIPFLDELSDEARDIGAVNTIVRQGARLVGHNTDRRGFLAAANEAELDVADDSVLLLGAGGAARAVLPVLLGEMGGRVRIANRSAQRAHELAQGRERVEVVSWPAAEGDLRADLIVNATPIGLHGEDLFANIDLRYGSGWCKLFDLIPTAAETPLARRAREAGWPKVVDGLLMLLHQAAASFTLWTGENAPIEAMRAALPRRI